MTEACCVSKSFVTSVEWPRIQYLYEKMSETFGRIRAPELADAVQAHHTFVTMIFFFVK